MRTATDYKIVVTGLIGGALEHGSRAPPIKPVTTIICSLSNCYHRDCNILLLCMEQTSRPVELSDVWKV